MWEAFLTGLYLQAGLAAADHLPVNLTQVTYSEVRAADAPINPYGVIEAGWSREFNRFEIELAARHFSSPRIDLEYDRTQQRGMDTLELRVRYRPFAEK